ncbi:GroES-like protein [Xylaria bambusicola]|uniref:GroES-like protein n=1 Tax=Xylaria bambusicola TaxID=326684 RepID=UPI002008445A|nr:GroES-like protein [Xylaria bambusicola]KAI0503098.1 GroES-like protein [Xylaria bambusicola]
MRALRYHGPYDVRLEHDIPEPECRPHQVKIKPSWCGICGSDVHAYMSPTAIPFKETPHPLTGETWPVTLGHEFSGDVVEVGSQAIGSLSVGDRVVVQPTLCCEQCIPCRGGAENCCTSFGFLGLMGGGGGLSDFVTVDSQYVFKLPDNVPSDIGALVEPFAVAWHAVSQANISAHNDVVIMGAGPIGLAALKCIKLRQPRNIIVVDITPERRRLAEMFGATVTLDPREEDVVARCKELCDGVGPAIAMDCAGVASSIRSAIQAARPRGRVVNVALWDEAVPFQFNDLLHGEKTITGSCSYSRDDFENVIRAIGDGSINVDNMITRKTTMTRVVEDGFQALLQEKEKHVKILIDARLP